MAMLIYQRVFQEQLIHQTTVHSSNVTGDGCYKIPNVWDPGDVNNLPRVVIKKPVKWFFHD